MRRPTAITLRTLLCLAPSLVAWTPANPIMMLQPQSRLWVGGTSTVRSFECRAAALTADIEGTGAPLVASVLAGEKPVRAVQLTVPVGRLDCSNGTMNEHMRKALKAEQFTAITFQLGTYRSTRTAAGAQGEIAGTLTLGGVQRPITMAATASDAGDGQLRVVGSYDLKMSDYGLKAPTLMMGTMKVNDQVKVGFDLLLKN